VSVEEETLSNIYLVKPADALHPVQITPGSGRYFDLSWTPDSRILYASDATGSADLWLMNADGSGGTQVTFGGGRNYAPVASPDGKLIAFHSNRSGNWHVWRTDIDGSNPQQLSKSLRDGNWPQFTPDSKFVIFHQTDLRGSFNIWRVAVNGGSAAQITQVLTMHPAISAVSGEIAAWYSETADNPHWKLAIFSPEGGDPVQVFDPTPAARPDTTLRWTPDGKGISFLDYENGVSNIWVQPRDGRPPHRLTSFNSGDIYSFDWAKDGTLVYSRGLTTADVVLIRDKAASRGAGGSGR
jgi:Tol biopolymer transport system component